MNDNNAMFYNNLLSLQLITCWHLVMHPLRLIQPYKEHTKPSLTHKGPCGVRGLGTKIS